MAIPHFSGYYLTAVLLGLCMIIGMGVAIRYRREVDEDLAPPTRKEVLDPLEQAYHSGLMHPEEIERIRASIQKSQVADPLAKSSKRQPVATAGTAETLLPGDQTSSPNHQGHVTGQDGGSHNGEASSGGGEDGH